MKSICITFEGMEDIAADEIKDLLGIENIELGKGFVRFDISDDMQLCKLSYRAQSLSKVLLVIDNLKLNDKMNIGMDSWLRNRSFAARSILIEGEHDKSELEALIGEKVIGACNSRPKVNLSNPDITIVGVLDGDSLTICIDYSGVDLSKRDYRIFIHPTSLKASVAYAMLKDAKVSGSGIFVDPFCGSSTIAIELAYFLSGKSINFFSRDKFAFGKFMDYDFEDGLDNESKVKINSFDMQMNCVKASEKNAKIAGVHKLINFSRIEVDWLETKFDEGSVDWIVTHPPQMSKVKSKAELEKIYNEFFYQAKYVLSKKGSISIVSTEGRIDEMLGIAAENHDFKQINCRKIKHGQQTEHILQFSGK